jgi:hypothetical protein
MLPGFDQRSPGSHDKTFTLFTLFTLLALQIEKYAFSDTKNTVLDFVSCNLLKIFLFRGRPREAEGSVKQDSVIRPIAHQYLSL